MQTFLFDTFNRYKRFSEKLDVETILCNKAWFVFNNSKEREIYIFQENGKLKISLNGKVTHATWEYIPANKSFIISGNEQSYMVHAAYVDNILFALQIDGTNEYAFLIDENNKHNFLPQSYNEIKQYFQTKEQELMQIQIEQLERERVLAQKTEEEQEEKRIQELRAKAHKIKEVNSQLLVFIFIICSVVVPIITVSVFPNKYFYSISTLLIFFTSLIFIIGIIERKKAEKWKKEHPNDPVNQYL